MKTVDIIIITGVAAMAALIIFLLIAVFTEGGQCILSPINYYQDKNNYTCFCFDEFAERAKATSVIRGKYPTVNFTYWDNIVVKD